MTPTYGLSNWCIASPKVCRFPNNLKKSVKPSGNPPFRDPPFRRVRSTWSEDILRWSCPWKWSTEKKSAGLSSFSRVLPTIWWPFGGIPLWNRPSQLLIFLLANCRPISTQHDPIFVGLTLARPCSCWENWDQLEVGEQGWCGKDWGSSQPTGTVCANKDRDIHAVAAVDTVNEGGNQTCSCLILKLPHLHNFDGSEFLQPRSKWTLFRSRGCYVYIYIYVESLKRICPKNGGD